MLYNDAAWELVENMKTIFLGPIKDAEELLKGEVPVLCHIAEKQQITPTELAHKFSLSTARIATILNNLERKQLIVRIHDTRDRRKVYIHLTEDGTKLASDKINELHEKLNELLIALGEEDAKEYLRLTRKVAEYMKRN